MREDFPDRPRIGDECDEPDVAAAGGASKWQLLPDPRHQNRAEEVYRHVYRVYPMLPTPYYESSAKDSPVNGTSASVARRMSGW